VAECVGEEVLCILGTFILNRFRGLDIGVLSLVAVLFSWQIL
jgi:hypothetical protein